jgi:secreted trypsin-like serine protease
MGSNIEYLTNGFVVGFGKSEDETKSHENIPKILGTPIHTNENCFLANRELVLLSSKRTFCAGSGTGVGVCNGDSGSGLFVQQNGHYYLRGIVSSSLRNDKLGCDVDTYAVFTDCLKFNDWVNGIDVTEDFYASRFGKESR